MGHRLLLENISSIQTLKVKYASEALCVTASEKHTLRAGKVFLQKYPLHLPVDNHTLKHQAR